MKKRRSTNSCLGVLFFAPLLKGGSATIYSDFFALFLREQKWQLLALVSQTSDLKAWPAVRPGSFATDAGYWQCSEPTTSRARVALLHLSTATVGIFYSLYKARPRWNPLLQTQSFKISSNRYFLSWILILNSRLSFCAPSKASAISSPRAWVTGTRNRQCGRRSLCSDSDDVYHCEGKCAEQGTSWRKGCRRSCRPADRLCCGICTVRDKDLYGDSRNALVVSCGDVKIGDRGRLKETLRALTCRFSSSLPEGALLNTAHPAVHLETRRW